MELNGQAITLEQIAAVAFGDEHVAISPSARPRIVASRDVIEQIVARDTVVYGVNTGFGKLSDVRVPKEELRQLQLNLVRSHACGIGNPLSEPEVRAMMLLRANVLTLGLSGIRSDVVELLCDVRLKGAIHKGSGSLTTDGPSAAEPQPTSRLSDRRWEREQGRKGEGGALHCLNLY